MPTLVPARSRRCRVERAEQQVAEKRRPGVGARTWAFAPPKTIALFLGSEIMGSCFLLLTEGNRVYATSVTDRRRHEMRLEHWFYTVPLRLRSIFRRQEVESDLDEELQYHLARKTEDYLAQGLNAEESRRAALRSMDGLTQRKEE